KTARVHGHVVPRQHWPLLRASTDRWGVKQTELEIAKPFGRNPSLSQDALIRELSGLRRRSTVEEYQHEKCETAASWNAIRIKYPLRHDLQLDDLRNSRGLRVVSCDFVDPSARRNKKDPPNHTKLHERKPTSSTGLHSFTSSQIFCCRVSGNIVVPTTNV